MRWSDVIGAGAAGAAAYYFAGGLEPATLRNVTGTVAQLSGTLLGFIAAAVAILMTMPDTGFTRNLRKTGHLRTLMTEMWWSAAWAVSVVVVAVAAMFSPQVATFWLSVVALALLGATLLRIALAGHAFYNVLDVFANRE